MLKIRAIRKEASPWRKKSSSCKGKLMNSLQPKLLFCKLESATDPTDQLEKTLAKKILKEVELNKVKIELKQKHDEVRNLKE